LLLWQILFLLLLHHKNGGGDDVVTTNIAKTNLVSLQVLVTGPTNTSYSRSSSVARSSSKPWWLRILSSKLCCFGIDAILLFNKVVNDNSECKQRLE